MDCTNRAPQISTLWSWQALTFICVLIVLLGYLLYSDREAQAQKPNKSPASENTPGSQEHKGGGPGQPNGGGKPAEPPATGPPDTAPGQEHKGGGPGQPNGGGKPAEPPATGPPDTAPGQEHKGGGSGQPAPVDESPVDESPVDESPVDESPVDESPVDESPVDESPVDEPGQWHGDDRPVENPPAAEPSQPVAQPKYSYEQPAYTGLDQPPPALQPAPWSIDTQTVKPVSQAATSAEYPVEPISKSVELSESVGWSNGKTAGPDMPVEQLAQDPVALGGALSETSRSLEESTTPSGEPFSEEIAQKSSVESAVLKSELTRETVSYIPEVTNGVVGSILEVLDGLLSSVRSAIDSSGAGLPTGSGFSSSSSSGLNSSNGFDPLLAILALLPSTLLYMGRFRELHKLPKPGQVLRLASERPG